METMYILFLGYGIGELVKYLHTKGYIKTVKGGVVFASTMIVLIQLLGNPTFITSGHLFTIAISAIFSIVLFSISIGSPVFLMRHFFVKKES